MPPSPLHAPVLDWYAVHARNLPWRRAGVTPWGVLVSEVMLQQTPVSRVLPVWARWLARWPSPTALADEAPGEAVRAWGRLGYPRRALRLHAAATTIEQHHGGRVPETPELLRRLPGVGAYTAAAVAAFAFGERVAVLDTNVRRVLARAVQGQALPPTAPTVSDSRLADTLLPDGGSAPRWSVAVMELGALVCTARAPRCAHCPLAGSCAWHGAGRPPSAGPPRPGQRWAGTDRQARGRLLAVLRAAPEAVPREALEDAWPEPMQRTRALESLVVDGLVEPLAGERYRLPGVDGAARR